MRARLAETSIKGRYDEYVAVYVDEMSARESLKMYLITHIDEAIENEYIKVFYQPVVDVKTNKLCSFEALARWMDPIHGIISPLDFIGGFYVATAEIEPQKFEPILHVRFWNEKLEAFIPNCEVCEDEPGWKILDGGKWVDYKETCADTWFLLDEVMCNLEYADGYQD